jgi:uncharacterized protein YjbI with pentapeptide repeats
MKDKRITYGIITGGVLALITVLIWSRWYFLGEGIKWGDIAVEFHGLVFDFIFISIAYLVYDRSKERQNIEDKQVARIERWKEELEDCRGWIADESAVRIIGILRRLKNADVKDVNIDGCSFKGRTIRDMIFPKLASSSNANFENTILDKVDIKNSNLDDAYFRAANLNSCSFENSVFSSSFFLAQLFNVDFSDAKWSNSGFESSTLNEVKFCRSDLKTVTFDNATLKDVDFTDAKVTVEQLLVARRLLNPKGLSSDFIAQIKKEVPALLTEEGVIRPMVW